MRVGCKCEIPLSNTYTCLWYLWSDVDVFICDVTSAWNISSRIQIVCKSVKNFCTPGFFFALIKSRFEVNYEFCCYSALSVINCWLCGDQVTRHRLNRGALAVLWHESLVWAVVGPIVPVRVRLATCVAVDECSRRRRRGVAGIDTSTSTSVATLCVQLWQPVLFQLWSCPKVLDMVVSILSVIIYCFKMVWHFDG